MISPISKIQLKANKFYNKAFGSVYDSLSNIQSVKQAIAENYEKRSFYKKFSQAVKFWISSYKIWRGINFSQKIIVVFTQMIIFCLSIYFIFKGEMTIGELIMFNGYTIMFSNPFVVLRRQWSNIQNGLIAIEWAEKILQTPTEKYMPENSILLSKINGEIVFDNVSFVYKKKHQKILDQVSFKVNPGEKVALVGESGVGKSTIADLVNGYYFSQNGRVLIDGHNIKNLHLKFLRSKITVVPQEIILFNDTIKNNIKYGSFGVENEKVFEAARLAHCERFIERFPKKYEQIVGERGIKLSSGQKQKVAIARAILRGPKILILDEPTSALDAKSEKYITESLESLMKNRTTIIIAHRLSTVKKADKILVLEKGKIVEQGKHEDLIKIPNGVYRHLYELQIGLHE
jgi:ABC-type multidrug transport system fused ATPase/permease subunit